MRRKSKLSTHLVETVVKPLVMKGVAFSEIAAVLASEHGVKVTRQAISWRVREENWGVSKVKEEGAKSSPFKDLAPARETPLTEAVEDVIVRRRCDYGHMWSGPSKRVIHMDCPLCSVKKKER